MLLLCRVIYVLLSSRVDHKWFVSLMGSCLSAASRAHVRVRVRVWSFLNGSCSCLLLSCRVDTITTQRELPPLT